MAKTPEEMAASMVANLKEKTGKTLPQWLKVVGSARLEKHGQIMKLLKSDHGVTHGYANLIALKFLSPEGGVQPGSMDLVVSQYSGDKAVLQPIYDAIVSAVSKFGKDVEIAPKKAYVGLRRNKQFAIVQPSTKTRVDVGINLKGAKASGRLEKSGSFNAMVSHRVRVTKKSEVDAELKKWLKQAWEQA